jgi:hypothetical protein
MKFVAALRRFATVLGDSSALDPGVETHGTVEPPMHSILWQTLIAPERPLSFFAPTKRTQDRNDDVFPRSQLRARW